MQNYISIKQDKVAEVIAQRIAAYWNGRNINVSGGVGAQWSDWTGDYDEDGNRINRYRVEGTRDKVSAITGTIQATASGSSVTFNIVYNIQVSNIG